MQDKITETVVAAIEPSLQVAEIRRSSFKPTDNLDAYDLYLKALSAHYAQTRESLDEALRLLDQGNYPRPRLRFRQGIRGIHSLSSKQSSLGDSGRNGHRRPTCPRGATFQP